MTISEKIGLVTILAAFCEAIFLHIESQMSPSDFWAKIFIIVTTFGIGIVIFFMSGKQD